MEGRTDVNGYTVAETPLFTRCAASDPQNVTCSMVACFALEGSSSPCLSLFSEHVVVVQVHGPYSGVSEKNISLSHIVSEAVQNESVYSS